MNIFSLLCVNAKQKPVGSLCRFLLPPQQLRNLLAGSVQQAGSVKQVFFNYREREAWQRNIAHSYVAGVLRENFKWCKIWEWLNAAKQFQIRMH